MFFLKFEAMIYTLQLKVILVKSEDAGLSYDTLKIKWPINGGGR